MDKPETKEALKELLEILVEHPELAERITITIRPSKLIQGKPTEQYFRRRGAADGAAAPASLIILINRR